MQNYRITRRLLATLSISLALTSTAAAAEVSQDPVDTAIGLLTIHDFVRASCTMVDVVEQKWELALSLSGIDFNKDMPAVIAGVRVALAALHNQHQDEAICAKFWNLFGPDGRSMPDMLRSRS